MRVSMTKHISKTIKPLYGEIARVFNTKLLHEKPGFSVYTPKDGVNVGVRFDRGVTENGKIRVIMQPCANNRVAGLAGLATHEKLVVADIDEEVVKKGEVTEADIEKILTATKEGKVKPK